MNNEDGNPVDFNSVAVPALWTIGNSPGYHVITEKNWSRYYSSPPAGADFAGCIYVIAARGEQANPGYRIRVRQIRQQGQRIVISVDAPNPDPKKAYPQVIVHPVAVAEVQKKHLKLDPVLLFVFVDEGGREITIEKIGL